MHRLQTACLRTLLRSHLPCTWRHPACSKLTYILFSQSSRHDATHASATLPRILRMVHRYHSSSTSTVKEEESTLIKELQSATRAEDVLSIYHRHAFSSSFLPHQHVPVLLSRLAQTLSGTARPDETQPVEGDTLHETLTAALQAMTTSLEHERDNKTSNSRITDQNIISIVRSLQHILNSNISTSTDRDKTFSWCTQLLTLLIQIEQQQLQSSSRKEPAAAANPTNHLQMFLFHLSALLQQHSSLWVSVLPALLPFLPLAFDHLPAHLSTSKHQDISCLIVALDIFHPAALAAVSSVETHHGGTALQQSIYKQLLPKHRSLLTHIHTHLLLQIQHKQRPINTNYIRNLFHLVRCNSSADFMPLIQMLVRTESRLTRLVLYDAEFNTDMFSLLHIVLARTCVYLPDLHQALHHRLPALQKELLLHHMAKIMFYYAQMSPLLFSTSMWNEVTAHRLTMLCRKTAQLVEDEETTIATVTATDNNTAAHTHTARDAVDLLQSMLVLWELLPKHASSLSPATTEEVSSSSLETLCADLIAVIDVLTQYVVRHVDALDWDTVQTHLQLSQCAAHLSLVGRPALTHVLQQQKKNKSPGVYLRHRPPSLSFLTLVYQCPATIAQSLSTLPQPVKDLIRITKHVTETQTGQFTIHAASQQQVEMMLYLPNEHRLTATTAGDANASPACVLYHPDCFLLYLPTSRQGRADRILCGLAQYRRIRLLQHHVSVVDVYGCQWDHLSEKGRSSKTAFLVKALRRNQMQRQTQHMSTSETGTEAEAEPQQQSQSKDENLQSRQQQSQRM